MGALLYSLCVPSCFGRRAGSNVSMSHVCPKGVLATITLGGCRDRDEEARARARGALRLLLCSLAKFMVAPYCGKFLKRWEDQTTLPTSGEIYVVNKPQLETDMEQTGSKSGKESVKAIYCHPAYLTYMQSTSWETLGCMRHSWNQDCQEKYK